jgi:hypothetical protein
MCCRSGHAAAGCGNTHSPPRPKSGHASAWSCLHALLPSGSGHVAAGAASVVICVMDVATSPPGAASPVLSVLNPPMGCQRGEDVWSFYHRSIGIWEGRWGECSRVYVLASDFVICIWFCRCFLVHSASCVSNLFPFIFIDFVICKTSMEGISRWMFCCYTKIAHMPVRCTGR